MKVFLLLIFTQIVTCQSSQNSESKTEKDTSYDVQKLEEEKNLHGKFQTSHSNSLLENQTKKTKNADDFKTSNRKLKSLAFLPYFPPPMFPFGSLPGYYVPQNKETADNSLPQEWLSRTEPFKKNPPLDSPTYYIRLPPNPYVFVPGLGYVSRPPSLSDPEELGGAKPLGRPSQVGNDLYHDPFYRVPINFMSNGKPTSVYELPSPHSIPKPESTLINLSKGPYVFNGKPSEIFLVAQIYDALYGDELTHFYP